MLNRYVWNLYLESGGKKVVQMFRRNFSEELTTEYAEKISQMRREYCIREELIEDTRIQIEDLIQFYKDDGFSVSDSDEDISASSTQVEVLDKFYEMLIQNCQTPDAVFEEFTYSMSYYSTNLSILNPDLFIPYYYRCNFNVLQKICEEFEIELPVIPAKKDYKDRIYYYGEISKAFLEFAKENGLSRFELYAFLYDFAPKYIGGTDCYIVKELPAPRSAYFIGADKNDVSLADNPSEITFWQCNPDTRVGDMIVMYVRTPISAVQSIWRACSVGFIDPFFYYYRCVYMAHPVKIKPLTLEKIKKDSMLKQLPIVRKNMQGINGVELYPSVYNHLVSKTKAKTLLLEYEKTEDNDEYTCEKDVENKLIKPLIEKLGYKESEYEQQLYVEIGNHNKALIPDFVLLPDKTHGHISGFGIIEAKRSIPSDKVLKEVFVQARSYARILATKYCAVASKEKIWITHRKDDFEAIVFEASWNQLNQEDCFYELDKMIGK